MSQFIIGMLVFIALIIVQSAKEKNKKKAAQKQEIEPIPDYSPQKEADDSQSPWADWGKKITSGKMEEFMSEYTVANIEPTQPKYRPIEGARSTIDMAEIPFVSKIEFEDADNFKGSQSHIDILGESFDLRKAVIYSELMKPKYLEWE